MEKILVVDDDTDLLLIMRHALRARGYQVTTLEEGSHVMETIGQIMPDLIILDINIGAWDGREICQEIKKEKNYRDIPLMMFSAEMNYSDAMVGCAPDAFIQKPVSTAFLLQKIHDLMAAA